jgi:hypothetical protein
VEIADRDIHRERRRLFWQRSYLATLEHVVKFQPLDAEGTSRLAAEHAAEAVRRLDDFEAGQTETAATSGHDPDRGSAREDDSPDTYLGGHG